MSIGTAVVAGGQAHARVAPSGSTQVDLMFVPMDSVRESIGFKGFAFGPSFEAEIERLLRPLANLRVRISLFAVTVESLDRSRTLALVHQALARSAGPTGPLHDGKAGILYVGPRPAGHDSDQQLERWVADELKQTISRNARYREATGFTVACVHRGLDEIVHPREIITELNLLDPAWQRLEQLRVQPAAE